MQISLILLYITTGYSSEICDAVNTVRGQYSLPPLQDSSQLSQLAKIHLENLLSNNYDPFNTLNTCDPHSWWANATLAIDNCCYPNANCMGNKGSLVGYQGITIENFYATRKSGGFFGGQITTSGITAQTAVSSWTNSAGHLAAMLSNQVVCGGYILEYRTDISASMYTITGMASLWMGNQATAVQPSRLPTNYPTQLPIIQPTIQPTQLRTNSPTPLPTQFRTNLPTIQPTQLPTNLPTIQPTQLPTNLPTIQPTPLPTVESIIQPTPTTNTFILVAGGSFVLGILITVLFAVWTWYYKKRTPPELPPQTTKSLELSFNQLVRQMLDPNDSDDAELLNARNFYEMRKIMKSRK